MGHVWVLLKKILQLRMCPFVLFLTFLRLFNVFTELKRTPQFIGPQADL